MNIERGEQGMNYDEMESGPEMDRAVAEKVMRWSHVPDGEITEGGWAPKGEVVPVCLRTEWAPSMRIESAWEVVEKMMRLGFLPRIGNHGEGFWFVTVTFGYGAIQHTCQGATAPLAICRAALKAKEQG